MPVSIEEYLHSSYRPDCDYIDGILEERHVGQWDHGRLQALLAFYLIARENLLGIQLSTEQRIRISPSRVRIPDVCVVLNSQPREQTLVLPPFLCIEILSPEDSMSSMAERIDDYLSFGVPHVWVIDPRRRKSYTYTPTGMTEARDNLLTTTNPDIAVPMSELFTSLDEFPGL